MHTPTGECTSDCRRIGCPENPDEVLPPDPNAFNIVEEQMQKMDKARMNAYDQAILDSWGGSDDDGKEQESYRQEREALAYESYRDSMNDR